MIEQMAEHFPEGINYTKPEGGMFVWVTLPEGISSIDLVEMAIKQNVAFVPGSPFYTNEGAGDNTFRLKFSNSDFKQIEEGIKRLAGCLNLLTENN